MQRTEQDKHYPNILKDIGSQVEGLLTGVGAERSTRGVYIDGCAKCSYSSCK